MRKFTLATIAFVCLHFISNAQIIKGSTFIGGSVSTFSDKSEFTPNTNLTNEITSWSIRPQIGIAVAENKIAGVFLNFGKSKYTQTDVSSGLSESSNIVNGGGLFYRRYYLMGKQFFVFGDAALGINFGNDERSNNNGTTNFLYYKSKSTEGRLVLMPGVSFAATKKLYLELAMNNLLSFSYQTYKITEYSNNNTVYRTTDRKVVAASANTNAFSNLSIGFRWIFPSKK